MQRDRLAVIGDEFSDMVRGVVQLHDEEIRGKAGSSATAQELFGDS